MTKLNLFQVSCKVQREAYEGKILNVSQARDRFLELFQENGIPVSEYKPYMGNNVLPAISLKG